jgi:hypothetical protein
MQDIYNYIAESNHVCKESSVATVPHLMFVLHVMLLRSLDMFYTFTLALPVVYVQ